MSDRVFYATREVISQFKDAVRKEGPLSAIQSAINHLVVSRRLRLFAQYRDFFRDRKGLEIGGPSQIFRSGQVIPIYPIASRVDNCNYSEVTVWSEIQKREESQHPRNLGMTYVCEGSRLDFANDESYDFVLSSHTLEHMANPIAALMEWRRILRYGGVLLLCVPHKSATFDHKRSVTSIEHMIEDYKSGTGEDDLAHLPEILQLHDLSLDREAGSFEEFRSRSENNSANRCLHHHTFVTESVVKLIDHAGLRILDIATYPPSSIIVLSEKSRQDSDFIHKSNEQFLQKGASWRGRSDFSIDRKA